MNEGKRWEHNIRRSLPGIIRLYDATNGYSGVCNPCDFIYYVYPFMFMIEAKSVKKSKLYWTAITENQHEQLDYYDHIYGVTSLIFIEYREEKECYILPYSVLKELKAKGEKGLSIEMAREMNNVYKIPAEYRIVNCVLNEIELKHILGRIGKMI